MVFVQLIYFSNVLSVTYFLTYSHVHLFIHLIIQSTFYSLLNHSFGNNSRFNVIERCVTLI